MRRFFITSEKFTGSGEIIFNDQGCLVLVDFRDTSIQPGGINQLLTAILPAHISKLEEHLTRYSTITCVEAEFEVTLEDFKREYPYKRNTHLLPPIWAKMDKTTQVLAWKAAQHYRKWCERQGPWYTPMIAAKWLKGREYLNDFKTL